MKQPGKKAAAERARAARRAAQLRKEAEERFATEATPEPEQAQSTPKRRKGADSYTFSAEDIVRLRDEQALSWRQVAVNLELGSPSAARSAYTALTGLDYRDSQPIVKRTKTDMGTAKVSTRKFYAPEWSDESDQDEIIERLQGARIIVSRDVKGSTLEEDIRVTKVVKLTWDGKNQDGPLAVHLIEKETGGMRCFRVADIKEVR